MSGHTPHEQTDVARQWMPYQFHGDTRWSVCTRKSSYCHTLSDRQDADVVAQLLNERERVADTIDALSAQVATLTAERDGLRKALEEIAANGPAERPERCDYTGNSDDDYECGFELASFGAAEIARAALAEIRGEK